MAQVTHSHSPDPPKFSLRKIGLSDTLPTPLTPQKFSLRKIGLSDKSVSELKPSPSDIARLNKCLVKSTEVVSATQYH